MKALQRGFGAIVAIIILVILATMSAGLVRLCTPQRATSTPAAPPAREGQAARA